MILILTASMAIAFAGCKKEEMRTLEFFDLHFDTSVDYKALCPANAGKVNVWIAVGFWLSDWTGHEVLYTADMSERLHADFNYAACSTLEYQVLDGVTSESIGSVDAQCVATLSKPPSANSIKLIVRTNILSSDVKKRQVYKDGFGTWTTTSRPYFEGGPYPVTKQASNSKTISCP